MPSTSPEADPDPATARVLALIDAATAEARTRDRQDLVSRLETERQRALRGVCTVLVVGEFNKGKSSLVNALLNARVCATDANVATAVPTIVRFGDQLTAATGGVDDENLAAVDPADVEALETSEDRSRTTGDTVEVRVPRKLLQTGLVLVDTPGVGGGLASAHAGRTLRALAGADAVVFVTDASQEITAAELELLTKIAGLSSRLVFALTKTDVYSEWRRIRDLDRGHLERAGLTVPILPLSSTLRHHGLRTGDRQLVADSGYPQLAAFLRGTSGGAAHRALAAAAAASHSAVSQLVSLVATERQALADPARRQEHVDAVRLAQQRADELRGAGSRWMQLLNDRIGDLSSEVDFDLARRMRTVRKEIVERLATSDPTREWVDLEPWIYEQTNIVLAEHLRLLRDEADQVADEVARRFGEDAWRLRADTDITRATARETAVSGDVGLAALAAARASRVELGIAALRGGSTGAVLTHSAGLLLGTAFAGLAVVPIMLARRGAGRGHPGEDDVADRAGATTAPAARRGRARRRDVSGGGGVTGPAGHPGQRPPGAPAPARRVRRPCAGTAVVDAAQPGGARPGRARGRAHPAGAPAEDRRRAGAAAVTGRTRREARRRTARRPPAGGRPVTISAAQPVLSARLRDLLAAAGTAYAGTPHADVLADLLTRLDEPLRVAIAGRLKAGKSTLLNALVGERLAATDAGECTRIVTWYADGPAERAWIYPRGNPPRQIRFSRVDDHTVLRIEPFHADDLERIVVEIPSTRLRRLTLIDTPGIGSLSADVSARTVDALSHTGGDAPVADAVLYLMRHLHACGRAVPRGLPRPPVPGGHPGQRDRGAVPRGRGGGRPHGCHRHREPGRRHVPAGRPRARAGADGAARRRAARRGGGRAAGAGLRRACAAWPGRTSRCCCPPTGSPGTIPGRRSTRPFGGNSCAPWV